METLLNSVFQTYGLPGFFLVLIVVGIGAIAAQLFATQRWMAMTGEIALKLGVVASTMERQGAFCDRHYQSQREQMEVLRSIGAELRGLVETIHESDMIRARELMDIIKLIAEKR
jgi:hypothetical protein